MNTSLHAIHSLEPAMILLLAGIIGAAVAKCCRLTPILGFFIAGAVIGPSALGVVHQSELITLLAEIGVVLLLFDIGLHLSFRQMWRLRHDLFVLGPLQVGAAGLTLCGLLMVFGMAWEAALIAGLGLALSSTAIVIQMLSERGQSGNPLGQTVTSILVFQDIFIVFLLLLVPALAGGSEQSLGVAMGLALIKACGALAAVYLTGKFVLKPLLAKIIHFAHDDLFTATILLIIIATASFTGYAGLSLPLGAFLAGLIISETEYCYMVKAEIQPFRTMLLGLFFISVGMGLDLEFLAQNWLYVLGMVVALMTIKTVTLIPVARLQGRGWIASAQIGLWLSQSGEFGFVLFGLAYSQQLFASATYQYLMVVIGMSFVLTPVMTWLGGWLAQRYGAREDEEKHSAKGKVLVLGFGAEGKNIARMLHGAGIEYLGVDYDQERIRTAQSQGFNIALGDVSQTSLYQSIEAHQARAAIFALEGDKQVPILIKRLKKIAPELHVFASVIEQEHEEAVMKAGAHFAVHDPYQHGAEVAEHILRFFDVDDLMISRIRSHVING